MIASAVMQSNPFGPPREPSPEPDGHRIRVKNHVFRAVALSALKSLILLLRIAKRKVQYSKGVPVDDDEVLPYATPESEAGVIAFLHSVINETFDGEDNHTAVYAKMVVRCLTNADNVSAMVSCLDAANRMNTEALGVLDASQYSSFTAATGRSHGDLETSEEDSSETEELPLPFFTFSVGDEPDELVVTWSGELGDDYIGATAQVANQLRKEARNPSFVDFVAFHLAYHILAQGPTLFPLVMHSLGTNGFRNTQSLIVLADPGDGHIFETTRNKDWMKDTNLHVQHPPLVHHHHMQTPLHDLARTRLHTGADAPTSFFVGFALGDPEAAGFKLSKAVNSAVVAVNDAFQLGAAECQFAMDGLRASQAVTFMHSLGVHARRNHRQLLSAVFNITAPLTDDLTLDAAGSATVLTEPIPIAHRATSLAARGGFGKVAWVGDGSGVLTLLGFKNAFDLVHAAHSMGISTQLSIRPDPKEVETAVYTGVDAIAGLSNMTHPSTSDTFLKVRAARETAEHSIRGRAAALLARLDTMHHEGSITYMQARLRVQLTMVHRTGNELAMHRMLSEYWPVVRALDLAPADDEARPCVGRARRILRPHEETALRRGAYSLPGGQELWKEFTATLRQLAEDEDEEGIFHYSRSEPWKSIHKAHTGFAKEAHTYFEQPGCLNMNAVSRAVGTARGQF